MNRRVVAILEQREYTIKGKKRRCYRVRSKIGDKESTDKVPISHYSEYYEKRGYSNVCDALVEFLRPALGHQIETDRLKSQLFEKDLEIDKLREQLRGVDDMEKLSEKMEAGVVNFGKFVATMRSRQISHHSFLMDTLNRTSTRLREVLVEELQKLDHASTDMQNLYFADDTILRNVEERVGTNDDDGPPHILSDYDIDSMLDLGNFRLFPELDF